MICRFTTCRPLRCPSPTAETRRSVPFGALVRRIERKGPALTFLHAVPRFQGLRGGCCFKPCSNWRGPVATGSGPLARRGIQPGGSRPFANRADQPHGSPSIRASCRRNLASCWFAMEMTTSLVSAWESVLNLYFSRAPSRLAISFLCRRSHGHGRSRSCHGRSCPLSDSHSQRTRCRNSYHLKRHRSIRNDASAGTRAPRSPARVPRSRSSGRRHLGPPTAPHGGTGPPRRCRPEDGPTGSRSH